MYAAAGRTVTRSLPNWKAPNWKAMQTFKPAGQYPQPYFLPVYWSNLPMSAMQLI